jgi:hypothetical protein
VRSLILAVAITAIVVLAAYLAAGTLRDSFYPEDEGPAATVTIVAVATDGLGGTEEHLHVPSTWVSGEEYDMGVRVIGLRSESGVVVKFSIGCPNISPEDVSVFYYDAIGGSWRTLTMSDGGDVLEGTLGLAGGIAMYEGYDYLHRLLIFSHMDGPCQVNAFVEGD